MLPPLFARLPAVWEPSFQAEAPWEMLGAQLRELLAALPSQAIEIRLAPEVHLAGDRIVIGRGTRIGPGATLEGPLFIGREVEIRPGAYVHSGCWIGDGCVVGAACEVKHSILLPGARAPHLNYVGDSILGHDSNLGAGTILSNFRHDGGPIEIPAGGQRIATQHRKLGAVLGDRVRTGCNCVLHPGAVVGHGTVIYPGVQLQAGIYAEERVIKLCQQLLEVEKKSADS